MNNVVLIGCGNQKLNDGKTHRAEELYTSGYFKLKMKYAKTFNCPIRILSAKHHVLNLDKEIEYYDKTLKKMKKNEKVEWAKEVKTELGSEFDLTNTNFIVLAGKDYYKYLDKDLNLDLVFKDVGGIGKQMAFMKKAIENA